jgi:ATP-binding cassette subfamily B protein
MRLYDVSEGSIFIDGQDIRDVTLGSLRQAIATIPQDPSLFHRSVMDNIRYGRLDATDKEVIEAAKAARADDFIAKLPQGYYTLVGERGVKLSGGQRQRIAIARAILKDAPILILDEATSSLDSITESKIQEALVEVMRDKTTIVIAHRLSTLLNMDRILVFENGEIVEDGIHEELMQKNGLFKLMLELQVGGILPEKKDGLTL